MLVHVRIKVYLLNSAVVTNVAPIGPVVGVCAHVSIQRIFMLRFIVTENALEEN